MSDGVDGVRSESEFRFEDGLTLKTGALAHEQMVEVAGDRILVNVENFLTEMERHRTVGPPVVEKGGEKRHS